jgi:hypothetical protein
MFDDFNICPYPGLRSFTEDESLYFKGRDHHIQEITKLLQDKKFLMVTGASGDGKSSVIFAGLIPNARAGFFKARYNNWSVAHFRPERSSVHNFANTLAPLMGDQSVDTIETEIRRGFGSLVDLYKSSPLYLDETTNTWSQASSEEQETMKRSANNLLIVVDQFEEFFTNPENFQNGAPSQDAQILVNLLLETSRIALKDDLPIYIVFTMRSDFIGQCAAFRGLPEFIGYSQFFVSRLKRNEFQQVIQEPAELNGNTISRRLVERLLYDLSEGIDQLPILQHVLNQVWHKADKGQVEMDLIHYAMVGGMGIDELPAEDQKTYSKWFDNLSEIKQSQFDNPGLNRVLDIHANELYEGAWQYYMDKGGNKEISKRDAKLIVAMTFACLTKIDDSRAVRNLMTLEEITKIINRPHLDTESVGRVINYFREQGNTFIRPFISDEDGKEHLSPDSVLDITHEALIRNWERLKKWANKEFEYYETFIDFEKQLNKWLASNQSRGYLLPIGPLTYFENWHNECEPNKFWINRYKSDPSDPQASLGESSTILEKGKLFIKKSAQKVAITRAYMKHGTSKVASFLAIILVIGLSGFYYYDAERKLNSYVLSEIEENVSKLLERQDIGRFNKGGYLVNSEWMKEGSLMQEVRGINNQEMSLDVANISYEFFFFLDDRFDLPVKYEIIDYIFKELPGENITSETRLEQINYLLYSLVYDNYYNESEKLNNYIKESTGLITPILRELVDSANVDDILIFNRGIENILNSKPNPRNEIEELITLLSPFNEGSKEKFDALYPQNSGLVNGRQGPLTHNGGYQEMAYLHAAIDDYEKVIACTDSLLKYNSNYWALTTFNNGFNTLGYFLKFGHTESAEKFIDYLVRNSPYNEMNFYANLLDRTGNIKYAYGYQHFDVPNYNPGLSYMPYEHVEWIFDRFEVAAQGLTIADERHYYTAICYKSRGIYRDKNRLNKGQKRSTEDIYLLFDQAKSEYEKVGKNYLEESMEYDYRYFTNGIRNASRARKYFYIYPDFLYDGWFNERVISNVFLKYLLENKLIEQHFSSVNDLEIINDWLANYYEYDPQADITRNLDPISLDFLSQLYEGISVHPKYSSFDNTFLDLLMANKYFDVGQTELAKEHHKNLSISQLQVTANRWEYLNLTYIDNEILKLAKYLASEGDHERAKVLLEQMPDNNYKSIVYCSLAQFMYDGRDQMEAFVYLDSAVSKGTRVDESQIPFQLHYRYYLAEVMSGIGGKDLSNIAQDTFRELQPGLKQFALNRYVTGIAYEGNYYNALQAIPEDTPDNQILGLYGTIISEEAERQAVRPGWEHVAQSINKFSNYIVFNANF